MIPWPAHIRLLCPSPTPRACWNSRPSSQWCHSSISSSVIPFSSCLKSFPALGSFQMSQLFASGGQSIGVSTSTSVLPMNTQDWSPLGWTGWISLQSKGLSRVLSNTTAQKSIQRTRCWRSRWTQSTFLFMVTSGIHLQTQKCIQNTSWEQTGVPDQWKRMYRTTQSSRWSPEPLEWENWLQNPRLPENLP